MMSRTLMIAIPCNAGASDVPREFTALTDGLPRRVGQRRPGRGIRASPSCYPAADAIEGRGCILAPAPGLRRASRAGDRGARHGGGRGIPPRPRLHLPGERSLPLVLPRQVGPREDRAALADRHPAFIKEMALMIGRRLRAAHDSVKSLAVDPVEARLAAALLRLAER